MQRRWMFMVLMTFVLDHVEDMVLEVLRHHKGWGAVRLVTKGCLSGSPAVVFQRENKYWGTLNDQMGGTNEFMPCVTIGSTAWHNIIRYQDNILRALIEVEDWGLSKNEKEELVRKYHVDYIPNELSTERARRCYMRKHKLN
ncbi:ACT domain-containing protein ACR8 [Frankliniella fusca]|uniref:ACT domain-containing protein ACR8 n=1 Tax=Frankliniella fusca TaxID=407009 RepID=A0AAE1H712_9NEOP|nr:ACT domain-containing protein ACR8 [Frankliniella fusca]